MRSAGTSAGARRRVTDDDLRWADGVLVMASQHASRRRAAFGAALGELPIRVLEIPDEYGDMHLELVELLQTAVPAARELPERVLPRRDTLRALP